MGPATVAFVELTAGRASLYRDGDVSVLATRAGSWNSLALGDDGLLYAAQNGGVVGAWRATTPATPAVERILPNGTVEVVAADIGGHQLRAPNDLVFGPDRYLWLTDPGEAFDLQNQTVGSRLFALGQGGGELVVERPPVYTNGIAFLVDGRLAWVESYTRNVCVMDEGVWRVLCQLPEGHRPDGLDIAVDGRLFITTVISHGITVVAPDGEVLDVIRLDDDALPTNCCFEGSVLWVTDFGVGWEDGSPRGRLWRVETDAVGRPQHRGRI